MGKTRITVAKGDGIGPEIMDATLKILEAAGAEIEIDEIEIGEKQFLAGHSSGIDSSAWDVIRKNKVYLKAPITTPQGGGYKSLNVTTRKALGLFANVRPTKTLTPFVESKQDDFDMVIIRENEEDLYAGIEHKQTDEVVQCLKLITKPGCDRIIRYAFEYAKQHGRKKVTAMMKDNIMKQTDGLFRSMFDEIGKEYPEIEKEHWIIDIGSAKIAERPQDFDVVVTLNLYGDIISDIAAEIAGSVGMAGSANIGRDAAMFEAIHGSAPTIAGQNIANPSGLLNGAVMMLNHIGQGEIATKIQNAWLKTIEDGVHTADIYSDENSTRKVSTTEFADAVIERLGQRPATLKAVDYQNVGAIHLPDYVHPKPAEKLLHGVDMFVDDAKRSANELGSLLETINTNNLGIRMITNRGIKVYPDGFEETYCTDHWRCRFHSENPVDAQEVIELLGKAVNAGVDVIKTENLYTFDGERGFSLGQGQ